MKGDGLGPSVGGVQLLPSGLADRLRLVVGTAGGTVPRQRGNHAAPRCSGGMVRGSLAGFLAGIEGCQAILEGVRNCPGVTPTWRSRWRVSWLWSEKPARAANS